jgi:hypothetical protein
MDIKSEDIDKKKIANNENLEIYNFVCNFADKSEKTVIATLIEKDEFPALYIKIKKLLPHRKNFYLAFSFKTFEGEIKKFDETNQDSDGYICGVIFEHQGYVETKKKNDKAKEFNLEISVILNPQKRINLQIFAIKFTDSHMFRVKTFFDQFIPSHIVRTPIHRVDFNINYQKIEKEKDDFLVIFSDENFIDQVMESEFEKADRIMFWSETHKAKELMAKNFEKIKACNNTIDFLLTPRFFEV